MQRSKGISNSRCDVGIWILSKSWDFFGDFLGFLTDFWPFFGICWNLGGIPGGFFGNSLGDVWEFFGNSLGILDECWRNSLRVLGYLNMKGIDVFLKILK